MRRVSYGIYTGAVCQPDFDWEKSLAGVSASPFNAVSVHLLTPWGNYQPFYPWPWNAATHKFDLKSGKLNQDWLDHLEAMLVSCWKRRHTKPTAPEFCFGDVYFTNTWRKNWPKYGSIYHPFRDNNIGLDWSASALPFYDAQGRFSPSPKYWLTWQTDTGPFATHGAIGAALEAYYRAVAAVVSRVQKLYPARAKQAPLWLRCFNETFARILPNGDIDYSRHLGDYNQISLWAKGIFEDAGVQNFRMVSDWFPTTNGRDASLPWIGKAGAYLKKIGFIYEIHNCHSPQVVKQYLGTGIDRNWTFFSMDGVKEDAAYVPTAKGIKSLGVQWESKLADYFKPPRYVSHNTQLSFDRIFPDNVKDIF